MSRRCLGTVILAVAVFGVQAAVAAPPTPDPPRPPEPPRAQVETTRSAVTGAIHRVPAGGDLQKALAVAAPGDVIVLEAGAAFVGPFELPAKPGSGWIVVTGSAEGRLPPAGTRVRPPDAAPMPKLIARGGPAITTGPGAHHFRFVGLEVRPDPGALAKTLIELGRNETTAERLPHHLVFERCVIHGDPDKGARRGVAMNSAFTAVVDSYLFDFKETGADSQAIASWNGTGPFAIVNNHLEAAGENVMFGGADPTIRDLVPADIVVHGNTLTKPLAWRVGDPAYAGTPWSVKNLFELKNARRVVVEGNLLEHSWAHAQNGFAILFTVRNQDGRGPWTTVEDVRFANNVVRRVGAAVNILGRDDRFPSGTGARIAIANNLLYDVGGRWGGNGTFVQLLAGATDVVVEQNTVHQSGAVVFAEGDPFRRFVFRRNIVLDNQRGIIGTGTAPGLQTFERYFPGAIITGNVIVGGGWDFPDGNFFPRSVKSVGFVDPAAQRFRLGARSRYRGRGGPDPGADFDRLATAMLRATPPPEIRELFASGE